MANLLPLIAFLSVMLLAATVYSENSIAFSVDTFTQNPATLTYQGDARIPTDSTLLRLTRTGVSEGRTVPRPWSVGRVMFTAPVQFSESVTSRQASFETTITFNITQEGNGASDGIAFFIAPVGSIIPFQAAGANLGIFPSWGTSNSLFAVEFDTYSDPDTDPHYPHIGIDINSRISSATKRFDDAIGQAVTARINYDASTKIISVVATTAGGQTYELSHVFDLSSILPDRVQVGVSASTGANENEPGIYDLLFWSFNSTLANVEIN